MLARFWLLTSGLLGATGVAAGALGAHALEETLGPERLATLETAVRYQLVHALALGLVAGLARTRSGPVLHAAGGCFLLGTLLFSGGICAWLAVGWTALVHVVPLGGLTMIAGWLCLAVAAVRREPVDFEPGRDPPENDRRA